MNLVESGVQMFSRVSQTNYLEGLHPTIFGDSYPKSNQIIEVVGTPETNKTSLALDILIRCILPTGLNPQWKGRDAVLVLTEFHINMHRIINVMNAHLKKLKTVICRKTIIEEALNKLTILNCYDQNQFEIACYSLEKIIHNNDNIDLVLVENITIQYWSLRFICDNNLSMFKYALNNYELLYSIVRDMNVVLIFTRSDIEENDEKQFHLSVDFSIKLKNCDNKFSSTVSNYSNNSKKSIYFIINDTIVYLDE